MSDNTYLHFQSSIVRTAILIGQDSSPIIARTAVLAIIGLECVGPDKQLHFRISLVYSGNTMMHGGNTPKIVRKQFCPAIKSILKGEADAHPCEPASEITN